jgi:hypothetical protein
MRDVEPTKPADLNPLAAELLAGLARYPAARHIVLGGYFALKHYCDYRVAQAVNAWWSAEAGESARQAVRQALQSVMTEVGVRNGLILNCRLFGDTESWELKRGDTKVFSFQIASRTVQLAPYLTSPWPPLQIESLTDNVASKMNALVLRGAPRDFVDVRQLISNGLATVEDCWDLWQRKNPDLAPAEAKAEVARHLLALELRRPLAAIQDPAERQQAAETRAWFKKHFLLLPTS